MKLQDIKDKTPSKDGHRTTTQRTQDTIYKVIGSGLPIFFLLSIIAHC